MSECTLFSVKRLMHKFAVALLQDQMVFLEADEEATSYADSDEKTEDFYGGGGQFRKGGKEHFPQLWCANGTYSSYGQAGVVSLFCILFCV